MAYVYPDGTITALAPPPGYVSDFANPTRQYVAAIYAASALFTVLAFFFVAQRYYVQLVVKKAGFQIEDATLMLGWAFGLVITALILRTCIMGWMGTHAWEMTIQDFADFMTAFYPMPIVYPLCILFAKLTLLLIYHRLNPERWFMWSMYFTMFFVVGSGISLALATAFPCRPLAAAYDIFITESVCIDRPALYKATAITGLISDVFLVVIPIPMVAKLKIGRRQKIALMAMFAVGIITMVTSAIRLVVVIQQLSNADIAWGAGPTAFWVIVEANLMIICGSLTTFRQFWLRTVGSWFSGPSDSDTSDNSAAAAGASNLVTIGGSSGLGPNSKLRAKGGKYSRFDDTNMFTLATFNEVHVKGGDGAIDGSTEGSVEGETNHKHAAPHSRDELVPAGEDGSEKGILQTTTITYRVSGV